MARLLKVFLCLRSAVYEPALLLNMAILEYLKDKEHPVWTMFNNNLGAFNEEAGELSFSLLQRFTRKDTLKADFKHLDEKYKLISLFYECSKDFKAELSSDGFSADYLHAMEIKPDSDDVKAVGAHFNKILEDMQANRWVYYKTLRKPKGSGWAKIGFNKRSEELQNPQQPSQISLCFSWKIAPRCSTSCAGRLSKTTLIGTS
jgi:hypothetical protein